MKKSNSPLINIDLSGKEKKYLLEALNSGWISSKGDFVRRFDDEFAKYLGVRYGSSVSNGTVALHLALLALEIKQGDEVIVPTFTFISPVNAIKYVGADPIFIDADPVTWNLDTGLVEKLITPKTKAIIAVHLFGNPVNMINVMKIAKRHNLKVIEDCAEAHGAEWHGQKVGTFGDVATFSFYGNKIITTGEGGMVVTNNHSIFEKVHLLKNHGMDKKHIEYYHSVIGYNYRLTNLQAAIGLAQLERIDELIEQKRNNLKRYNECFLIHAGFRMPIEDEKNRNVAWMYGVVLPEDYPIKRNELIERLDSLGIESRPFFMPIHKMPMYQPEREFKVAEHLGKMGILLPSGKLTDKQIQYIVDAIRKYQKN